MSSYDEYDDEYDEYDDDWHGDGWLAPTRIAALFAAVVVAAGIVWFGLIPFLGGDGGTDTVEMSSVSSSPDDPEETDETTTTSTTTTSTTTTSTTTTTIGTTTTAVAVPAEDVVEEEAPSTDAAPPPTVEESADPDVAEASATPVETGAAPAPPSYATLPDGSPVPALAIFDGPLIVLSGAVPSQEAADRLRVLALANSTDPDAEVASFLSIDPNVPVGVGVRVIEMNSPRFPEGSPTVSPEHGAQLDRVSAIMTALPNISVVVIGHADQRGDDETNRALSTARARAAADYLASRGVDPTRLSSRGAGESDLLTLNNDEASLALNRRTEFVFVGLLIDAAEPV